jgi:hypothetical protein
MYATKGERRVRIFVIFAYVYYLNDIISIVPWGRDGVEFSNNFACVPDGCPKEERIDLTGSSCGKL